MALRDTRSQSQSWTNSNSISPRLGHQQIQICGTQACWEMHIAVADPAFHTEGQGLDPTHKSNPHSESQQPEHSTPLGPQRPRLRMWCGGDQGEGTHNCRWLWSPVQALGSRPDCLLPAV